LRSIFEIDKDLKRIDSLTEEMKNPDFWNDKEEANKKIKELSELKEKVKTYKEIEEELLFLRELMDSSDSEELKEEEIEKAFNKLEKKIRKLEIHLKFRGKYDKNDALIYIYSGAGGVDAQDWASTLLRMYQRYAENRGWSWKILDQSFGEQGGIKSAVLEISGLYAYGYLAKESGVHRIVRISPFSAKGLRHTSFALVEVLPEVEGVGEIKIDPNDLRIDTFRASGPGGQYLQKTESAVRITHLPTKTVVSVQSERSQHQNKLKAMKILQSRLLRLMEEAHVKELSDLKPELATGIEWGNQIRSYVLNPYKMVKDHRTGVETGDVDSVLDGKLDEFIEAEIG